MCTDVCVLEYKKFHLIQMFLHGLYYDGGVLQILLGQDGEHIDQGFAVHRQVPQTRGIVVPGFLRHLLALAPRTVEIHSDPSSTGLIFFTSPLYLEHKTHQSVEIR